MTDLRIFSCQFHQDKYERRETDKTFEETGPKVLNEHTHDNLQIKITNRIQKTPGEDQSMPNLGFLTLFRMRHQATLEFRQWGGGGHPFLFLIFYNNLDHFQQLLLRQFFLWWLSIFACCFCGRTPPSPIKNYRVKRWEIWRCVPGLASKCGGGCIIC